MNQSRSTRSSRTATGVVYCCDRFTTVDCCCEHACHAPIKSTVNRQPVPVPMPQWLPPQLPEYLNHSDKVSEIRFAYSKILLLEKQAAAVADPKLHDQKLIHARILGYLIREGPLIQASEHVATEVNLCQNNEKMDQIGEMYQRHFIRLCEPPPLRRFCLSDGLLIVKKYKGATPAPSSPPSRPPFQTKKEMIKDMLVEAPRHHDQVEAKKNVSHFCTLRAIYCWKYKRRAACTSIIT